MRPSHGDCDCRKAPPNLIGGPLKMAGIPFYPKHGMCKRETVWAEPKHTLQLQVLRGDKAVATRSITFSRSFLLAGTGPTANDASLEKLLRDLHVLASASGPADMGTLCPNTVAAEWEAVAQAARNEERTPSCDVTSGSCLSLDTAERNGDLLRLSNSAKIVVEVDYDHPYYMNSVTPWIGNAQVEAQLNADGSLSEGSIQVTDQTWSTILGTVGALAGSFATYASSEAALAAAAQPVPVSSQATQGPGVRTTAPQNACPAETGWPMPGVAAATSTSGPQPASALAVTYQITPSTVVYLHDHVREDAPEYGRSLVDSCTTAKGPVTDGNVTVSKQGAPAPAPDPNSIQVSGQLTMPKPAAVTK
jgi:hypothetical protein